MTIEVSDLEGIDWDWFSRYGAATEEELAAIFALVYEAQLGETPIAQALATAWAHERCAELLRLDGDINLIAQTKERIRGLVAETLERGESLQSLTGAIRDDVIFSRSRAEMIARTETASALGQGSKAAAVAQGRDEKHWSTQGSNVCDICLGNEEDGWIPIGDSFSSGHDTIPAHPRCRCDVLYRTAEKELAAKPVDVRCPDCNRLIAKNMTGEAELFCPKCRKRFWHKPLTPAPILVQ